MSWAEEQDWFGLEDLCIDELIEELDDILEDKNPKIMINKGYWIQGNNEPIALKDMTYKHLCNCVNMIENGRLDREWALPYLKTEIEKRLKNGSSK